MMALTELISSPLPPCDPVKSYSRVEMIYEKNLFFCFCVGCGGMGVLVGVGVSVDVAVGVSVAVGVAVMVGVEVGVAVDVLVFVGVFVGS
jgi:hypothetical protein